MKYYFPVYSNRWGHQDRYQIEFTPEGWIINHKSINGPCNPSGEQALFMNLEQDHISYPVDVGSFLEHLWQEIKDGSIQNPEEIQTKLCEIGEWISICERSIPKWKGWNI